MWHWMRARRRYHPNWAICAKSSSQNALSHVEDPCLGCSKHIRRLKMLGVLLNCVKHPKLVPKIEDLVRHGMPRRSPTGGFPKEP